MAKYASKVVEQAKSWLGKKEADGSHRDIIDLYNSHKPLAINYKVKYTDSWCATFVSAVSIALGYTDIIPTECGCERMIELFKKIGSWVENENRTPAPGEIIFYDWDDSGSGDNKGWSDHVGIVEKVSGGKITVIEGNLSNAVKRRTIAVNAKGIRGYGVPKYDTGTATPTETHEKPSNSASSTNANTSKEYTLKSFIMDVQKATGAKVDGIAGSETLLKTVTVSSKINRYHPVVKAIQKRLNALGFNCGAVDGIAGAKFNAAVIAYQASKGCIQDGELTARHRTWQHILGIIY